MFTLLIPFKKKSKKHISVSYIWVLGRFRFGQSWTSLVTLSTLSQSLLYDRLFCSHSPYCTTLILILHFYLAIFANLSTTCPLLWLQYPHRKQQPKHPTTRYKFQGQALIKIRDENLLPDSSFVSQSLCYLVLYWYVALKKVLTIEQFNNFGYFLESMTYPTPSSLFFVVSIECTVQNVPVTIFILKAFI